MHATEFRNRLIVILNTPTTIKGIVRGIDTLFRENDVTFTLASNILARELEIRERESREWSLRYRLYLALQETIGQDFETRILALRDVANAYLFDLPTSNIGFHLAQAQHRAGCDELDA